MKKILIAVIGIILLIAIGQGIMQGVTESAAGTNEPPAEKAEPAEKTEATPAEQIESALNENITAESITLDGTFDKEPYAAQIEFLANENFTTKSTVEGMRDDIKNALYTLKESGYAFSDISINVNYPLADQYGKVENGTVIKAMYTGDTLEKLGDDKHALANENLSTIANDWWEHDAIK